LEYKQLTSAGGVVYRITNNSLSFLILGFKGRKVWCLPKGLIETGESELEAAEREVNEETGINDIKLNEKIGTIAYKFWLRGRRYHKTVHFYLFETEQENAKVSLEHDTYVWVSFREALKILTYPKEKEMLKQGFAIIENLQEKS
jgi:8-oxo-dGTP pyrophosphatase MutT (NUDIX family)